MPDWLDFQDPLVQKIVFGAVALLVLTILVWIWNRRREAQYAARRRSELRQHHDKMHLRQQEIERLGARIIATGSAPTIAGFNLVRQIEAVFTDGHPSPTKAVEVLKALAAQKGANAIINLSGERLPSGKCVAHGDAVIVQPLERRPRPAREKASSPESFGEKGSANGASPAAKPDETA